MGKIAVALDTLAREIGKTEAEVLALACEAGLRQLWRERALARYLRGEVKCGVTCWVAGLGRKRPPRFSRSSTATPGYIEVPVEA